MMVLTTIMKLKLFTDLNDVISRVTGGLRSIVNLPKAVQEIMHPDFGRDLLSKRHHIREKINQLQDEASRNRLQYLIKNA